MDQNQPLFNNKEKYYVLQVLNKIKKFQDEDNFYLLFFYKTIFRKKINFESVGEKKDRQNRRKWSYGHAVSLCVIVYEPSWLIINRLELLLLLLLLPKFVDNFIYKFFF